MLENILVLEFGKVFSAPLCAMMLGDLGATVIKIEKKDTGDESRKFGMELGNGLTDYYCALNRNKKVISLDLKNTSDMAVVEKLIEKADVLIHNNIQKSFDALGLSYDRVKKINRQIIYVSISGYGSKGRFKDLPCQDITIQAVSGFMSLNGFMENDPVKTGIPVIDYVTGQNAAIAVLSAIIKRSSNHRGEMITTSLLESALHLLSFEAVRYLNLNTVTRRNGNRHSSIAPYNAYHTKDSLIVIAIANDEMFTRFRKAIKLDVKGMDTNSERLKNIEMLDSKIERITRKYRSQELKKLLDENKISCAVVRNIKDAFLSGEVKQADMVAGGKIKLIKTPFQFSGSGFCIRDMPKKADEDRDYVLKIIGDTGNRLKNNQ